MTTTTPKPLPDTLEQIHDDLQPIWNALHHFYDDSEPHPLAKDVLKIMDRLEAMLAPLPSQSRDTLAPGDEAAIDLGPLEDSFMAAFDRCGKWETDVLAQEALDFFRPFLAPRMLGVIEEKNPNAQISDNLDSVVRGLLASMVLMPSDFYKENPLPCTELQAARHIDDCHVLIIQLHSLLNKPPIDLPDTNVGDMPEAAEKQELATMDEAVEIAAKTAYEAQRTSGPKWRAMDTVYQEMWKGVAEKVLTAIGYPAMLADNMRLRDRLEITHEYDADGKAHSIPLEEQDDFPDGISARDETIRLLDEQVGKLKEALKAKGE